MRQVILIIFIALVSVFLSNTAAGASLPALGSSKAFQTMDSVVEKIKANPKAYKKDRVNGYNWAKTNLSKNLEKVKQEIWSRRNQRIFIDTTKEKEIYNRLNYNEAIRHALSMAGLDPLVKQSNFYTSKIASINEQRCFFKVKKTKNKKQLKKRKAKAKAKKRACEKSKSKALNKARKALAEVNNKLEPAKQEKLQYHQIQINKINDTMAEIRLLFRNLTNNETLKELEKVTMITNHGRVKIGLSKLPLPNPKMSSVSPAQSEFWGLMTGTPVNMNRAAESGMGTTRGLMWYPGVVANDGSMNWESHDNDIRKAATAGIRTIPVFYGGTPGKSGFTFTNSPDWPKYEKFVRAAVKRYGPKGDFWQENPAVPYLPINAWEVWNEPNLKISNPGGKKVNFVAYQRFLIGVAKAIKSANKQAIVVLGGLANIPNSKLPGGIPGATYLKKLYKYPEFRASVDAVGFHPYARTVQESISYLTEIREIMDKNGDKNKSIYITEIGWATSAGETPNDTSLVVSHQQQAANLTEVMTWFKANKDTYKIATVMWYAWQDIPGPAGAPKINWASYAGLFDLNGNPKPAWYAWLAITGGK